MEPYVFDIILITLAVVILLHLLYNNSLLVNSSCDYSNGRENMINIPSGKSDNVQNNNNISSDTETQYTEGIYRDKNTSGIDRTSDSNNWYHVANKLVTNNDASNSLKYIDTIKKSIKSESQKESNTNSSIPTNLVSRYMNQQKDDTKEKCKAYSKGKLVFDDNYEGLLSSDPFDADEIKIRSTFGPKTGYSDFSQPLRSEETYTDVYGNECTRSENDLEIKRYIRDFVLDGSAQCGCVTDRSKSDFTKTEVDEYREQALRFHDKIYGSSSAAEDPVDRMNKVSLDEGIKAKGQTIADFYDNVVGGRVSNLNGPGFIMGTSVPAGRCVKPPVFDNESGVPQGYYTSDANAGGRYIMRDNWMYSNENPNNGGVFFDGIKGDDPYTDVDRMIDY
jgi:hypothetical protein